MTFGLIMHKYIILMICFMYIICSHASSATALNSRRHAAAGRDVPGSMHNHVTGATQSGKSNLIRRIIRYKGDVFDKPPVKTVFFCGIWQKLFEEWKKNSESN